MVLEPALKVCWPISEPKMVCTAQTLRLSWPGVAALLHLVEGRGLAQSSSDARQLCVSPGGGFGRFHCEGPGTCQKLCENTYFRAICGRTCRLRSTGSDSAPPPGPLLAQLEEHVAACGRVRDHLGHLLPVLDGDKVP